MLLWDKLSPWPHITKQGLLLAKWLAEPSKNSGSKEGWMHIVSCECEKERDSKRPGWAKPHVNSTVVGSTVTSSWPHHQPSLHSAPQPRWMCVYLCLVLCVSPLFCGPKCLSLHLQSCLFPHSLSFLPSHALCLFFDACEGTTVVLPCYPLVHMLLLPHFSHDAPLSSPRPANSLPHLSIFRQNWIGRMLVSAQITYTSKIWYSSQNLSSWHWLYY